VYGECVGLILLKYVVSYFIIREVKHHPPPEIVENHLFPFEGVYCSSEFPPVGSEAVYSTITGPHPGFQLKSSTTSTSTHLRRPHSYRNSWAELFPLTHSLKPAPTNSNTHLPKLPSIVLIGRNLGCCQNSQGFHYGYSGKHGAGKRPR
jgi:hypothetical protein